MPRILAIREFILLNRRCLYTSSSINSGPADLRPRARGKSKLTHVHVQETLHAMRALVSNKSEVSQRVKKILGTNDSWARPPGAKRPTSKNSNRDSVHRTSASGKVGAPTILLQPHEVSDKVINLAKEGKLEDAIEYVTNLPLDALNVQAWNTLLWEANKAKRFKVAWEIYNQMKKKGFEPSTFSYKTMLSGLSRIDDFQTQTLALERAHKLYASFIQYTARLRKQKPDHPELHPIPIHSYMTILAKAGLRSRMWDTFYAMDKEGPMAPDAFTFSSMLQHLDWRTMNEKASLEEWNHQVASDTALIWRLMLSSERKNKFEVDSYALAAALRHLAKGQSKEHDLAFEIVEKYLGLHPSSPSQTDEQPANHNAELENNKALTQFTLQAALEVCRVTSKPERVITYVEQVMKMNVEKSVIDIHHMDQLFGAYFDIAQTASRSSDSSSAPSSLPKPSRQAVSSLKWLLSRAATYFSVDRQTEGRDKYLWPTIQMYNLVLATCRECKDWESALTVLEGMTGSRLRAPLSPEEVSRKDHWERLPITSMLSNEKKVPSYQRRQYFRPTAESLFDIMKCAQGYAIQHNKPSTAHECLSAINTLGGAELLTEAYSAPRKVLHDLLNHPHPNNKVARLDTIIKKSEERKKYWAVRASAIVPALFSLATRSGGWNRREYERAVKFRNAATDILNTQRRELGKGDNNTSGQGESNLQEE